MRTGIFNHILMLALAFCCAALPAQADGAGDFSGGTPIDADFGDVLQGLNQSDTAFRTRAFRNAWRGEVLNLTQTEGTLDGNASDFMAALDAKASAAAKNNDTRGEAMVYREAGLQMLSRTTDYSFHYPQNYMPLLQSLLVCEAMHYNAFQTQPDAWTGACVVGQMTAHHARFAGTYVSASPDGLMVFPSDLAPVTPAALYADSFAGGQLENPAANLPGVSGSADRLVVRVANAPYGQDSVIYSSTVQGDTLTLALGLSRVNNATGEVTPLGEARVVFVKDAAATCGYALVAFQPQYPPFPDVF